MPSYATSSGPFADNPKFQRDRVVVITGGSGKLGRATVAHFMEQEPKIYVISLDLFPPPKSAVQPDVFVTVDLTDAGKTLEALIEVDLKYKLSPRDTPEIGIVHLAALPTPGQAVNSVMFQVNVMSTYNVLEAARKLGFLNVTCASSVTLAGLPFEPRTMDSLPVTEDSQPPYPSHSYSLSKLIGEVMADQYCRWNPELKVCSMRISWVKEQSEYPLDETLEVWRKEIFGYIDSRDAAAGMLAAYSSKAKGHSIYYIAGDDHSLGTTTTKEVVETHYPGVPWKPVSSSKYEGLVSCEKAKRELGWSPKYTWRSYSDGKAEMN